MLITGLSETRSAAILRTALAAIPRTPHNDVEIQTGLGILSCILDEHHIAAEHFRAAVDISPQDFMLWNRLGATLANSDQVTMQECKIRSGNLNIEMKF